MIQQDPLVPIKGVQQLTANPAGGTWSGAVNAQGVFDPAIGAGSYQVSYSVDFGSGCIKSESINIQVNEPNTGGGECNSPTNLALNQPAEQSSTYGDGIASIAIDGNTNGGGSPWGANASISHSTRENQPWWQVDLGQSSQLTEAILFNRSDCCQERLSNFYVLVSEQPFSNSATLAELLNDPSIQTTHFPGQVSQSASIDLNASGRYVRIQLQASSEILSLAELQIMGCPGAGGTDPCEGTPSVSIDPAGPFSTDQGVQQLTANPAGGTWSGAVNAQGVFDPAIGAGSYQVSYSVDFGSGCIKSESINIHSQ